MGDSVSLPEELEIGVDTEFLKKKKYIYIYIYFFFFKWRIIAYKVVLVSVVQQWESAISNICPLPLEPPSHLSPL